MEWRSYAVGQKKIVSWQGNCSNGTDPLVQINASNFTCIMQWDSWIVDLVDSTRVMDAMLWQGQTIVNYSRQK